MRQFVSATLLAAAVAFGFSADASAMNIRWTGAVYHVEACPGPSAAGQARCHAHAVSDSRGNHITRNVTRNSTPSGYGPTALRSAYNVTGAGSSNTIVAIVDAYGYTNAEADLATYRSTYGLPACTTANGCFSKVNENGTKTSYPAQDTGWAQETALDLDMVSAMCPNCKILLVGPPPPTTATWPPR